MPDSELQAKLLHCKNRKLRFIDVEICGEKTKVGVMQVSLGARAKLQQMVHDAKNADAMKKAIVESVIESCCDLEGNRMFAVSHRESLFEQPAGGWIDAVANEAGKLMRGAQGKCPATLVDADGKTRLDDAGKPKICNGELVPDGKFCPYCGADAPSDLEVARGN